MDISGGIKVITVNQKINQKVNLLFTVTELQDILVLSSPHPPPLIGCQDTEVQTPERNAESITSSGM